MPTYAQRGYLPQIIKMRTVRFLKNKALRVKTCRLPVFVEYDAITAIFGVEIPSRDALVAWRKSARVYQVKMVFGTLYRVLLYIHDKDMVKCVSVGRHLITESIADAVRILNERSKESYAPCGKRPSPDPFAPFREFHDPVWSDNTYHYVGSTGPAPTYGQTNSSNTA